MNQTSLDFAAIQDQMQKFHAKYGCLPNTIFLPSNNIVYTTRIAEIFGMEVKFAACQEPIVGLMVK